MSLTQVSALLCTVAAVIMVGAAFSNGNWAAAWFACTTAYFAWQASD